MAKELTIRIKIHYGEPPKPPEEKIDDTKSIIAKVIAATIIALSIIIFTANYTETGTETGTKTNIANSEDKEAVSEPEIEAETKTPAAVTSTTTAAKPNNSASKHINSKLTTKQQSKIAVKPTVQQQPQTAKQTTKTFTANQGIKSQFTSGIKKLKPIDNLGNKIRLKNNKTSKIYYYTVIEGQKGNKLTHRWIYNGKSVANISSKITQKRQVMYSSKTVTRNMAGTWQVLILNHKGNILSSAMFTLTTQQHQA